MSLWLTTLSVLERGYWSGVVGEGGVLLRCRLFRFIHEWMSWRLGLYEPWFLLSEKSFLFPGGCPCAYASLRCAGVFLDDWTPVWLPSRGSPGALELLSGRMRVFDLCWGRLGVVFGQIGLLSLIVGVLLGLRVTWLGYQSVFAVSGRSTRTDEPSACRLNPPPLSHAWRILTPTRES